MGRGSFLLEQNRFAFRTWRKRWDGYDFFSKPTAQSVEVTGLR